MRLTVDKPTTTCMTPFPVTALETMCLNEIARIMRFSNIGAVPIVEDWNSQRVLGIITDRDIVTRAVSNEISTLSNIAADIMTREVYCCRGSDSIARAIALMTSRKIRRLPVLDRLNFLIGIITEDDIATRLNIPGTTADLVECISQSSCKPEPLPISIPIYSDAGEAIICCADLMTKMPIICEEDTPVSRIARIMQEKDIGFIPVLRSNFRQELSGVITDRDITIRAVAESIDPNRCHASDVMTRGYVHVFETDPIETAIEKMSYHQIKRLIVLNNRKVLTGVITTGDIACCSILRKETGKLLEAIAARGITDIFSCSDLVGQRA